MPLSIMHYDAIMSREIGKSLDRTLWKWKNILGPFFFEWNMIGGRYWT